MIDRRKSPLVQHNNYAPWPREIARDRAQRMFNAWVNGKTYEQVAAKYSLVSRPITADEVRGIIRHWVKILWQTHKKWRLAEVRCHALAMELALLRIGEKADPDQPIQTLGMPDCWVRAYLRVGVDTVNQLRSIDAETLLAFWKFPFGAIRSAIMKLDKLGLGHRLVLKKRVKVPNLGKKVER